MSESSIVSRSFSFSYSKLKNFEICPRRYHELDVKKAWGEPRSEQLSHGDAVHAAMATALRDGGQLPAMYGVYQPWVDKIARTEGELLVECKWAITEDMRPTPWFGKNVWLRSIADAAKINDNVALIIDFKTGKSANVDPVQNVLASLVALIHFPKVLRVRSDFVWLEEDHQTTQVIDRHEAAEHWAELMPRVDRLRKATETELFPPLPNRFCARWCAVSSCEYHGKRF